MEARVFQHVADQRSFCRGGLRLAVLFRAVRPMARCPGFLVAGLATIGLWLCGCTPFAEYVRNGFKVGPNYHKPPAPLAPDWIDASDKRLKRGPANLSQWWKVFNDPVLDRLICTAYQQNLTLREAGFRVLQARAQLGIAVGTIFPQTQSMTGSYTREALSRETANRGLTTAMRFVSQWDYGFNLAWELDFWGRFRRAIESAGANLDVSVEDYDDVLVTLLSDVATAYVQMRTLETRILYARKNLAIQRLTYKIAVDKKGIFSTPLDVDQALSILRQTEAGIPELEISLRQTTDQLCILLGIPPEELRARLGKGNIPTAPPEVVLGIPADLLRRRPDIRRAERQTAAQSAQIGVAESLLYPHFTIRGTLDYQAALFKNLFRSDAMSGNIMPGFQWDILNYGRLLNNVRLQDARFQELVAAYQQTVLVAQREAEDGLVTFLKAQERTRLQGEAVAAGAAAVKAIMDLWDRGLLLSDYTRVAQLLQNQVQLEDTLAQAQGEIALGLIQVYKAMGGGWQIRCTGCSEPVLRPQGTLAGPCPAPVVASRSRPGPVQPIQQTSWTRADRGSAAVPARVVRRVQESRSRDREGAVPPSRSLRVAAPIKETVPQSEDAAASFREVTILRPEVKPGSREEP
jgi:NodT family efflux transporter outer membrane factor (OMF) lipoprotein